MVSEQDINNILNDFNKFSKEDYELINTYQMKALASYDINKYNLLKNTSPRYFQSLTIMSRFGDTALRHKELVISQTMEHLQLHKEILLQLIAVLQSLVSNPNVVDYLINMLNDNWYGNQDFKQFISNLITEEMQRLNNLYTQHLILVNQPLICFVPEIFNSQNGSLDTVNITDFYTTLDTKYILEP